MASNPRQSNKMAKRGGAPEPARRAWTGARSSPTFSPPNSSTPRPAQPNQNSFPPLGQSNGTRIDSTQDRLLQSLSGLTGTTVTLSVKEGQRYEGVISSTSSDGDAPGVTLKDVKEISTPGAPLKDQFFIPAANIDTWASGPADAKLTNGDSFRTDSDISRKAPTAQRELQPWQPSTDALPAPSTSQFVQGDEVTFGPGSHNASWDQFAVNEQLFGVTASFDEDVYTTKLDRSAADFKERERKAQRIANEINGAIAINPHIAEERNQNVDDSGVNEEDKYGAVVRGTNAYIPPGARKAQATAGKPTDAKSDVPAVSVNAPDGDAVSSQSPPASSKAPSPAPSTNSSKPPADPLPAFRDFVTNEKQRLTQRRQALVKSEMDKRVAELVKFSQSFKLNKPIPEDLVPILAKDEDKQRAIKEKSTKDAASVLARNIGPTSTNAAASRPAVVNPKPDPVRKPSAPTTTKPASNTASAQLAAAAQKNGATKTDNKPAKISMFIQPIPPFKGRTRQSLQPPRETNAGSPPIAPDPAKPTTPTGNNRLNANASSFRPNPKANAFTPGATSPKPASPKPKDAAPAAPNPFFGARPIKKTPVNVKDDFNPFKHNKVAEPSTVLATWPYNGKRYSQMFPAPQHAPQPHPSHAPPQGPPPIPPPSYEEDSAAQAAARGGYVYYPPYGYPGQPIMPGMPPPGPPGAFIPTHYMPPMPYPPGMPPNVYPPPGMAQMPHQAYMPPPPPPPGTYPPPPAGQAPRPSMPPTPIPAHAHPYYHHSPQLQHAVPYPMMMPPPPNQHPYEGGPAPVMNHG